MLKLCFNPQKILKFSKGFLLPMSVFGIFLVYFFSVSEFSEKTYHLLHILFLCCLAITLLGTAFLKITSIFISTSIIYICYLIINSMRYAYGEDYMFSAGYNIWSILVWPNLFFAYILFQKKMQYKRWSWFYIALFAQTALIEKLQSSALNTDSFYFYKHVGMLNYPALVLSVIFLFYLLIEQMSKGKILNAAALFSSAAVFCGLYFSDNLFAFILFFLAAVTIELVSALYYAYYNYYRDEEVDIANTKQFFKEANKKYPLKYSIVLMYIDEYENLLKRFGIKKMFALKKMFVNRIHKVKPTALIYNYKADSLVLAFKNANTSESFEDAENIRRLLAKSIFVFNENNHLQLTVSQCVSEKKRSDFGAQTVLSRAEKTLKKACKFTRNITVKA